MPRPSFSVVAGTLVVLVGFGAIRRYVAPLIPPPRPATSPETASYLRAGETQALRWQTLSPELVQAARRQKKPLLLVMGSQASRVARELDERVFSDSEIIRYAGENFLLARLDLTATPAWRATLAPVSRTAAYRDEGIAVAVISPDGRLVAGITVSLLGAAASRDEIIAFLFATKGFVAEAASRPTARFEGETQLAGEMRLLDGERRELPPSDAALGLRARTDRASGLVLVPGGARLSPWTIDAIARAGEPLFARDALRALAASPMHDPLRGGVFVWTTDPGASSRRIECTKSLISNATLAETSARVAVATGDAEVDSFARRLADWSFARLRADAPAFVLSDQGADPYSPYYSLTLRRLRASRMKGDAAALRARLGADRDPQALGRIAAPLPSYVLTDLAILAHEGVPPPEINEGLPDVAATVIARLLGTARLLGQTERARELGEALDALESPILRDRADLPLLLALADAHFEDFLANGRAEGLEIAARDLSTALARYSTDAGTIRAGDSFPGMVFAPTAPDLADGTREATAAAAVRLADAIGRALDSGPEAIRLRVWARACAERYAPILGTDADHPNGSLTPESAAFLVACARVGEPTWRVVAGRDPVGEATDEVRRHPYALVVPAIGIAVPNVPRKESGIVIRSDEAHPRP